MGHDLDTHRDEFLDHVEHQIHAEVQDDERGFEITDDSLADWAIRKIAQAQQRIEGRKQFVETEINRLREWQEAQDKKDEQTIGFFTAALQSYFERLRRHGLLGDRKSYSLPHGTLQVRTTRPRWARADVDALTRWASERGLVRTKVEPAWADISKHLRPTGDYPGAGALYVDPETGDVVDVPGVTLESPADEAFTVKPEVI